MLVALFDEVEEDEEGDVGLVENELRVLAVRECEVGGVERLIDDTEDVESCELLMRERPCQPAAAIDGYRDGYLRKVDT